MLLILLRQAFDFLMLSARSPLFQPPCITPSDAVKNLQLCLNPAIDVTEISDVLTEFPLYFSGEQSLRGVPQHVNLAQKQAVIFVRQQVVLSWSCQCQYSIDVSKNTYGLSCLPAFLQSPPTPKYVS